MCIYWVTVYERICVYMNVTAVIYNVYKLTNMDIYVHTHIKVKPVPVQVLEPRTSKTTSTPKTMPPVGKSRAVF